MEIKLDKDAEKDLDDLLSNSENSIEYKVGLKISESIENLKEQRRHLLDIKSIKANKNLYQYIFYLLIKLLQLTSLALFY